jgi:hypothetical protein
MRDRKRGRDRSKAVLVVWDCDEDTLLNGIVISSARARTFFQSPGSQLMFVVS